MISTDALEEWRADCLKWRGRVLDGKLSHWCVEWDGLPVDETTEEWACGCYDFDLDERFTRPWRHTDGVVHGTDVYFYARENTTIRRRHCDRGVVPEDEGASCDGPVTCFGCMGAS